MRILVTISLFIVTAIAENVGCYLPYLWLRRGKPIWLLLPAAVSLAAFAWLLSLHPTSAGRVYAAYGGVYVSVALLWLWLVDDVSPQPSDYLGVAMCLGGMAIIMLGPRG
jgi:small multidrug resistance family-3 protein